MKKELKKLAIKVVKTMAETASGLMITSTFIHEVNFTAVLSATALSGVVTVLLNIKDLKVEG